MIFRMAGSFGRQIIIAHVPLYLLPRRPFFRLRVIEAAENFLILAAPMHPQSGEKCGQTILKMVGQALNFLLECDNIHIWILAQRVPSAKMICLRGRGRRMFQGVCASQRDFSYTLFSESKA